ncbi:MAG: 4-hydroxy-tetrahydrodipicolinate reductase, partial [Halobacteria archaeon]|nr:4-hydroxy-tetrahydrodipicolinate reductase [Halobacteria archaeon]
MTVKVVVVGACGRMGSLLVELASEREDIELVGAVDRNRVGEKIEGADVSIEPPEKAEEAFENADVVVEFTSPEGTDRFVEGAVSTRTPYVTGTTGLSDEVEERIKRASKEIPVVRSSNFATGVNVFWRLL